MTVTIYLPKDELGGFRIPKFKYGQFVMTPGIQDLTQKGLTLFDYFNRHLRGDWGDLCEEDKQTNEDALKNGDRLVSAYETPQGKIWIITEWDRSVTTALLPSEY